MEIIGNVSILKKHIEDQKIDNLMSKIETKIAALQKDLEQVEQQEGKAIAAATPNYGGVG